MDIRYAENFPALSPEDQLLLSSKKVFIAGLGGLGGYLLEFMLRLGVGEISVCDGDCFSQSNLNRQLLCSCQNISESKASAAGKRAGEINPDIKFTAFSQFIDGENAPSLLKGADAVLDGLDSSRSRKLLFSACEKAGIPYIYGAVSGSSAQAALLLPGSRMLESLYPCEVSGTSSGILSFTPALAAAMQSSLCLKLLCSRPVEDDRLYCADLFNMDFENFSFK